MQAKQMEQSPATYAGMGEEARGQVLVATLNTHYEGRAHAEAFNNQGKTDIIIRYEAYNLFICECKFWSGAVGFTATIDQLFRYTAWRDTKLAIVMFVQERGLTEVVRRGRAVLEEHPQFSEWKEPADETSSEPECSGLVTQARLADLNIFFVHTPGPKS